MIAKGEDDGVELDVINLSMRCVDQRSRRKVEE